MALDATRTFCTAITEPERYASYDFTSSTTPTEAQLEEYCYDVAAIIVFQTEKAGARKVPPASSISDPYLARLLTEANAIGASYLARHHIYTFNGDQTSLQVMQRLAGLWQMYVGEGSVSSAAGAPVLQLGTGGLISQIIQSASGSAVLRSDVTEGEVRLATLDSVEVAPPFKMSTVD